ncbi:hypothetical protein ACFL03_16070, partial [Thermodesulfobacteriota bacterium]
MSLKKPRFACLLSVFFLISLAFLPAKIEAQQVSMERKIIHLDKPVDILLLQDESGSMTSGKIPSDPKGLRQHAANYLIEQLRIAGPQNEMGFSSFSTYTALEVPIGKAFKQILDNAKKGKPGRTPAQSDPALCYETLDSTPFYMYTDMVRALQGARIILEKSNNKTNAKHVILLTDGEHDPWPGDPDRFGTAQQYLEKIKNQPCRKRAYAGKQWLEDMRKLDKRLIQKELREFRKNRWKIHTIGFANADRDMLQTISKATQGKWDPKVSGISQLESMLKNVIPLPENVIEIYAEEDICGIKYIERRIPVERNLKAIQFGFSFVKMYKNPHFQIFPDDLTLEIIQPDGTVISSTDKQSIFQFYTGNKNELFRIAYFQEHPPEGNWKIKVKIKKQLPRRLCGDATVLARRVHDLEITTNPAGPYQAGQPVRVTVGLKNEANRYIPLQNVSGEFPDRGTDISFRQVPNENRFTTDLTMPDQPGRYELFLKLVDARHPENRPISPEGIEFIVTPPKPCKLKRKKGQLDNIVLGDQILKVSRKIELELEQGGCPSTNFRIEIPELKLKSNDAESTLPHHWFNVQPMEGVFFEGKPESFTMDVSLPPKCGLPDHIQYGTLYKGDLKVFISGSDGEDIEFPISVGV